MFLNSIKLRKVSMADDILQRSLVMQYSIL